VPPVIGGEERFSIGAPTYQSVMGHTVLPAEWLASQAALKGPLHGAQGELLAQRLAVERTTLNPQCFGDDVAATHKATRAGVLDAASALRAIEAQELHLSQKFPSAPTRLGSAAIYDSGMGLQRAAMSVPSAAASIFPMVEPPAGVWNPSEDSLTALLEKAGMKPPAAAAAEEGA